MTFFQALHIAVTLLIRHSRHIKKWRLFAQADTLSHLMAPSVNVLSLWKWILFLSFTCQQYTVTKIIRWHQFLYITSYLPIPNMQPGRTSSLCRFCVSILYQLYGESGSVPSVSVNISSAEHRIRNYNAASDR